MGYKRNEMDEFAFSARLRFIWFQSKVVGIVHFAFIANKTIEQMTATVAVLNSSINSITKCIL